MNESYLKIFLRFLHFGFLAWGGPVAQIAMIKQELVEQKKWISQERFNRVLAVYQMLPGPEAHELCVYFGMLARGRWGGFLSGLGFMLPGFALMFLLSWLYVAFGLMTMPVFISIFSGVQPAVCALIFRAVHRIGSGILSNPWLWAIAVVSALAQFFGVHFLLTLSVAGASYFLAAREWKIASASLSALFLAAGIYWSLSPLTASSSELGLALENQTPSQLTLLISGLRSGLLTFGGAYTAIPFLQHDAVVSGRWMTNEQFLDGLALSGMLPAPLIIFGTFVGYLGGGPMGALLITFGIFLPAFLFTLIGHGYLEKLVENKMLHSVLDGVTAGVVGLVAVTALELLKTSVQNLQSIGIFLAAVTLLYFWKAKFAVPVTVVSAGLAGFCLF